MPMCGCPNQDQRVPIRSGLQCELVDSVVRHDLDTANGHHWSLQLGEDGMALRTALVCALLTLLAACTTSVGEPRKDSPPAGSADNTTDGAFALPEAPTSNVPKAPRPQVAPRDWSRVPWVGGRRRVAPAAAEELPGVLQDPQRARLVYHPTERLDDPTGWAGERLLFLGVDDQWRVLDMEELGLPADWWPGVDTYGSGSLSRDGRVWAGKTDGGVVLLELSSGAVRHVDFPPGRSRVVRVDWMPGRDVVSAYAARPRYYKYDTFQVDTTGRVKSVRYPGWRTRFDVDGTPVEVSRAKRHQLTIKRWEDDGITSTTWTPGVTIPRSMRTTAFGVFGATDVALYAHRGWPSHAPAQVWALDKGTGAVTARLQVPATTSIEGWADDGTLRLLVANRRVVEWQPRTGKVRQVLELPGPYPGSGEWAAATVAFPSQ